MRPPEPPIHTPRSDDCILGMLLLIALLALAANAVLAHRALTQTTPSADLILFRTFTS